MIKLAEISDHDLQLLHERMMDNDNLVDEVKSLKVQIALLRETVTILAHDLNDRLARRKK